MPDDARHAPDCAPRAVACAAAEPDRLRDGAAHQHPTTKA
jgi:hypothetical protein